MGFVDEEDPLFPWGCGVDLEALFHYRSFDHQQQQLPQEISVLRQDVPTQTVENGDSSLEKARLLQEQEHTASNLRDLKASLTYALHRINVSYGVLVQVWVPYREENMVFLTTRNQPYVMAKKYSKLERYRDVSSNYIFPLRYGSQAFPGLPGRVFMTQAAEWTPNVQFYSCHEFLRVKEAKNCDVKGTLALPVMEANSRACVAVLEVALSTEKLEYGPEIDDISNALQAASLRTVPTIGIIPEIYENRQSVWLEIGEILMKVCETHTLPLAQVWIPVLSNGVVKLITKNTPFCGESGFRKPCEEHALFEGQGLPGRALTSTQAVFCVDIKTYKKDDYPLGHYARLFNLSAALAIRLRSVLTGKDDYILEFFLPPNCKSTQQQLLLDSFANILQRVSRSLRTILEKEVAPEKSICNAQEATLSTVSSGQFSEVVEESSPTSSIPCGNRSRKKAKRGAAEKFVSLNVLQQHFTGKLKDAAKIIGVCPTTLKKICRKHGIERWPSRKLKKIDRQYKKIQNMLTSVKGLSHDSTVVSVGGVSLLGLEKTGYQAQSQTHVSSSVQHQFEHEATSHKSSSSRSNNDQSSVLERNSSLNSNAFFTIKVTNGHDMVRFKLPVEKIGMDNLREEIGRRMNLEGRDFGLKYLDEDKEWIRLESNEEFTECMAVVRSNKNKIKVLLVL